MVQQTIPIRELRRDLVIPHGGESGYGFGEAAAAEEEVDESAEERGVEVMVAPDSRFLG